MAGRSEHKRCRQTKDYCERDPDCHPADPNPLAPGIFLGTDINEVQCAITNGDVDLDGVVDYCEWVIASQFAPMLATSPTDEDLTREPYWAARSVTTLSGPGVRVISADAVPSGTESVVRRDFRWSQQRRQIPSDFAYEGSLQDSPESDSPLNGALWGAAAGLALVALVDLSGYVDGVTDASSWERAKGLAVGTILGAAIGFSIDAAQE